MGRALIVSAGESANEYLSGHLAGMGYARPLIVPSAAEARRRLADSEFELIVVNAPLPDEFGHEFCMDAMDKTDAGVIFLVKAAAAEQMETKISEYGVVVVPKPFSSVIFSRSMSAFSTMCRAQAPPYQIQVSCVSFTVSPFLAAARAAARVV